MKLKKYDYVLAAILIFLVVVVGCIALIINGNKTKDVRKAKSFLEKILNENMLDKDIDIENINFQRIDKNSKQVEPKTTTLITQEYGVDLDKGYNVVGFSNKGSLAGEVKITKEEAIELGKKYVSLLYEGSTSFKGFKEGEKSNELPYYTLIFSKVKYGYEYYFDEILISINKTTGKLDGYSISNLQGEARKPEINKTKEEAITVALNKFNEVNKNGVVREDVIIAYGLKSENAKKSELSFVITIDGKDDENKEVRYIYFVSTETGMVLDSFRSVIKETRAVR